MNHNLSVSQSIEISKNVTTVWQGLTDPETIKEYLYGTETITTWEVGSEIIFQGEYEGHIYKDKGVVLKNILNQELSYSYWSGFSRLEEKPENYSNVTYTLKSLGPDTTHFTWTQAGFANEKGLEHTTNGMPAFLQQIKESIEKLK